MVGTRAFARPLNAKEHRERGDELLLIADQWMNIQHMYRADACATLAVAHYYASALGGNIGANPKENAEPEGAEQHKARALALINGAENVLARQNYAHADALASVAVAHYVSATIHTDPRSDIPTQPNPIPGTE